MDVTIPHRPLPAVRDLTRDGSMSPNPDPPDPRVFGRLDPDTDPSIIKKNSKNYLNFYCFVTSFLTFYL